MPTDSFLWLRHVVECRKGCRHSHESPRCKLGRVLRIRAQKEAYDDECRALCAEDGDGE